MRLEIPPHPPALLEHHVRLPDQVADLLCATPVHNKGYTGRGVRIAVIDSGFFSHPFYTFRNYKIRYIPTRKERKPHEDEYGHGTAQLASLFAIAPEAEALAIKCMDRDPSYALEKALELNPQIICCAWGFNIDVPGITELPREYRRMGRLIRLAVERGITVVAAGGNGQRPFPGCMPEVIAAGGVYYAPSGEFHPSDVSSRFVSSLYPGRVVPDICGLVGNRPHGRLLLVPVPPGAKLARRNNFTAFHKGWAMFSGTSAATAMVSGACALLLQKNPGLTPAQIKLALVASATAVGQERLLNVARALDYLKF